MSRIKNVNIKDFGKLNKEQQITEVKKLAKRANVRIALLEDKGLKNTAYKKAERYNKSKGKKKNRFYEGKNYKYQADINNAYYELKIFLDAETSTLGGVRHKVEKKVEELLADTTKGFDYNRLKKLTKQEKIYASKKLATISNRRLKELEKNNINYYAYANAEQYNESVGRRNNRFYRGGNFKNERDLNIHLQNELFFLNAKSSTLEGIAEINDSRINKFREKGLDIKKGQEKDFYNFLSSRQFKALKQYADSNQTIETYVMARNKDIDVAEIQAEYEKFINGELTEDEVQERLNVAKWQQGGLLK